jgi:hypothetical protein
MVVAGWVHRHQLTVIEFLQAENRLLKEGREEGTRTFFLASTAQRCGVGPCGVPVLVSGVYERRAHSNADSQDQLGGR